MKLSDDERGAVVALRVEKAEKTMAEAKGIVALQYWNATANRLYYACYYITSALLISKGYEAHTHSGVIHLLGTHFIKEGIVSKENGRFYARLFDLRQTGDYDDIYELTQEDVLDLIEPAEIYIRSIKELISS